MAPYVGKDSFSFDKVHCAPPTTDTRGAKSVRVFMDSSSTMNSNMIQVQLCEDESSAIRCLYPLNQAYEGGNQFKRDLKIVIEDPKVIAKMHALEERLVSEAVRNSKQWFKMPLTEEQVRLRLKPILTPTAPPSDPTGEPLQVMKIKFKTAGSQVPTKLVVLDQATNTAKVCKEDKLELEGAVIIPVVSAYAIYFLGGDTQFGLSFNAEHIMIVQEGAPRDALGAFTLKRKVALVHDEEEERGESSSKVAKVELDEADEAESAM